MDVVWKETKQSVHEQIQTYRQKEDRKTCKLTDRYDIQDRHIKTHADTQNSRVKGLAFNPV